MAFVDLAGFTTMTAAHGDDYAANLAERFVALARKELDEGDRLVKSIGDAVMLTASSPTSGLALVSRICVSADAEPAFPILRTGLHHGPVVHKSGDVFGGTVNLAARVAARAAGGQMLATKSLAQHAAMVGMRVLPLGPVPLRGWPDPVQLFEVVACPTVPDRRIDPVCRMAVERSTANGWLRRSHEEYWFCSVECAGAFAARPERFLDPS